MCMVAAVGLPYADLLRASHSQSQRDCSNWSANILWDCMRGQQIVYSVPQPKAVNKCVLPSVCTLFTVTVWSCGLKQQLGVTVWSYGLELQFAVMITVWSNKQHRTASCAQRQRSPVSQQLLQRLDFFLSCEEHQDVACLLLQMDLQNSGECSVQVAVLWQASVHKLHGMLPTLYTQSVICRHADATTLVGVIV